VTGSVELPEGVEMVMPGDNIKMTIELISPIGMERGPALCDREAARTVGGRASSQNPSSERHGKTEHPHPPQGVRFIA